MLTIHPRAECDEQREPLGDGERMAPCPAWQLIVISNLLFSSVPSLMLLSGSWHMLHINAGIRVSL